MANGFKVDPEKVKGSAKKLNDKKTEYDTEVKKLYDEIANLKTQWKGQSSDTFNQQIESYRTDFNELSKVIAQYVDVLNQAVTGYTNSDGKLSGEVPKIKR